MHAGLRYKFWTWTWGPSLVKRGGGGRQRGNKQSGYTRCAAQDKALEVQRQPVTERGTRDWCDRSLERSWRWGQLWNCSPPPPTTIWKDEV